MLLSRSFTSSLSRAWSLVSICLMLALLVNQARHRPPHPLRAYKEAQKVALIEAQLAYRMRPTFVDARSLSAYQGGHIQGALWAADTPGPPTTKPIVTYCAPHCGAANSLALKLIERGYARVYVLEGGIAAWQTAGLPMAQTPKQP